MRKDSGRFSNLTLLTVFLSALVLLTVGILFLDPLEKFRENRDRKRIEALELLDRAIQFYLKNNAADPRLCEGCASGTMFSHQPISIAGQTPQVIERTEVGGTGWVPIDLSLNAGLNKTPLLKLPIDPLNSDPYVYVFTVGVGGKFKLSARLEATKNSSLMENDGGNHGDLYELGTQPSSPP